jgi:DNA-binding response OmpR family regulator
MRRALVVDDHPDTAQVLAILLSMLGHEAEYALRGRDAIAHARRHDPDLILVDIGLPDITGYEVAEAVRGDGRYIVAISSAPRRIDRIRAARAGFDEYLTKPIGLATLRRIVGAAPPRSDV